MFIADLHIHSKYSRATSKECVPEYLDFWARRKGISLVGTGDFTHPAWREELAEKLVPAEEGLYTLRDYVRFREDTAPDLRPRFVISGEISSIYKKNGRVRKVHNLILLPSLESADTLSRKLETIGNIRSDGRPILGLDSRDLLEITLESCPEAVFIPAHIWTPHFSLFGAFSGFDTVEECFGDLTPYIHALETGLSSDPPMNWRLSALDGYQLVSNSDAHSPSKLGREANLLDIEPSFPTLAAALQTGEGLEGTIEFYPEEGKYHFDGHRNCHQCLAPSETIAAGGRCPVCGKPVTVGVLHRVEELADRAEGYVKPDAKAFESLVPLPEVIAASEGGSAASGKVNTKYETLLRELGSEFHILRDVPVEDIGRVAGPLVAEGVRRLRRGEVRRSPGYDSEYGVIQLLDPSERSAMGGQVSLFGSLPETEKKKKQAPPPPPRPGKSAVEQTAPAEVLNGGQTAAVTAASPAVAVVAGPGTGKTKTLVARIAWLVEKGGVKPGEITAVTFTNKAAGELRERLEGRLSSRRAIHGMTIGTFHSICLDLLSKRPGGVRLVGSYEALEVAEEVGTSLGFRGSPGKLLEGVSRRKNGLETGLPEEVAAAYCARLRELGLLDFDDLLLDTLTLWGDGAFSAAQERGFRHLLVDEFQDCNAVQYELIRSWNRNGRTLFVIGDPDQAIYGFRGSDPACFGRLAEDYPALETIRLTKNYRSTPEILRAALPIVDRADGRPDQLKATVPTGLPVRLLTAESDLSEAIFVAKEIARQMGGMDMLETHREGAQNAARDFGDFAVLYRTRRQADLVEQCLGRDGIPCVVAGRDDFLTDGRVRGALCLLRHLLEPDDALSLRAALKLVWDCPPDLCGAAAEFWARLEGDTEKRIRSLVSVYAMVPYIEQWGEISLELLPRLRREKPRKLLEQWVEAVGCGGAEPVRRLLNMAVFYRDVPDLLENLTLGQEGDLLRSAGLDYDAGAVRLMTLHGSKGLEFPVVFLCGVKAGAIPLETAGRSVDESEERRLLYVGMTRAREELILLTRQEPSRFLNSLPADCVERGLAMPRKFSAAGVQLSLF